MVEDSRAVRVGRVVEGGGGGGGRGGGGGGGSGTVSGVGHTVVNVF